MKSAWLILLPFGGVMYLVVAFFRWLATEDRVSQAWQVDNNRRAWGVGIEQSCVRKWPLNKIVDENGWWNARKHRMDA